VVLHEKNKVELRRNMSKPHVEDTNLKDIMEELYRPNAKIGSGSTASALREEIKHGIKVGGKEHLQKIQDRSKNLEKWIKNNPTAKPSDRAAAENVLKDMKDALQSKK
jgi:hypothetical protein